MTIGEQTTKWYEQHELQGAFAATLLRCFLFGVVVKRPSFVLLAEEVLTDGEKIIGVGADCPKNCWWIHYINTDAPGTTTTYDFCSEAPYPLPYLGFKRRGKTKIYSWEKLVTKDRYGWCTFSSSASAS